ncbi:MAG: hypothetical protein Q9163_004022 [Psora crenata]
MATSSSPSTLVIDQTTIFSLLLVVALLIAAYIASLRLLPVSTTTKLRIFFIWHFFDFLIHIVFEGSFLYNCFFTYTSIPHMTDYPHPASLKSPGGYFLGYKDRLYGSNYGSSLSAKIWQEYAKADKRWGEADQMLICMELLTVFGAGPLAAYICELLRREETGKFCFWATVLATGELYGASFGHPVELSSGFMTFAPEWLSGSLNLDTSNFLYLWVYLAFFNLLWVFIPLWVLVEAYNNTILAFARASGAISAESKKKT